MHVLLASVGTDGDIFPYAGLGVALRSRGHSVSLAASGHYEGLAKTHGFTFHPLVSVEENDELFGNPDFWNPLKTAPISARWGVRFIRRQYEMFSNLVTPETVIVSNPAIFAVSLVHEKLGVPRTNLIPQPWMIPSSIAPPIMPGLSFLSHAPRQVWKMFWRGLDCVGDILLGRELNGLRASLGLKPARRILGNWFSSQLVIGMFPDWYGPPQADWPSQMRLTGFPMFDGGKNETLAPEVLEFCQAGNPPVAFTFGTGMAHSAHLFRAALDACTTLGVRGIFLTKFRDQLPETLPSSVLHCAFAPFQKLFPHCAAIVHHGGIGTTANAMAAGIPQLIRPICFDQLDNGVRVKKLGAGDCLRSKSASGKPMATALAELMTQKARTASRNVMKRFDGTDALAAAAGLVERLGSERTAEKIP
jgi:rhamnosyltransferase subunit B